MIRPANWAKAIKTKQSKKREINKSAIYWLFLATLENRPLKGFFSGERPLFSQKSSPLALIDFFRTPFERSEKQCVSNRAFINGVVTGKVKVG
jgi:hypothetical protein